MKILVTGSNGFIGQNLARYLTTQGHQVEGWEYIPNTLPDPSGYDWVVHLGAISSTTFIDVDKIIEQNYEYSMQLLQLCDTMGVNFQYASSASVYGPTTHFTEDGPLQPQSPYAWTKYLFDRFITLNLEFFDVKVQGFRYFNVYGPLEEHKGEQASPYTKFTKQAKENRVIKLFEGSKEFKRDFVSVEDVCKLHEKMFDSVQTGIFNVGTGQAVSFEEVAQTIAQKYNAAIEYVPVPENLKSQYQTYTCADLTKLNNTIDMQWTHIKDYINDN
jgi:ADP-L-glycero-D-manno-heptose 6-epimerase